MWLQLNEHRVCTAFFNVDIHNLDLVLLTYLVLELSVKPNLKFFWCQSQVKLNSIDYHGASLRNTFIVLFLVESWNFLNFLFDLLLHWIVISSSKLPLCFGNPLESIPNHFVSVLVHIWNHLFSSFLKVRVNVLFPLVTSMVISSRLVVPWWPFAVVVISWGVRWVWMTIFD